MRKIIYVDIESNISHEQRIDDKGNHEAGGKSARS